MQLHIVSYCLLGGFVIMTFLCQWIPPSMEVWIVLYIISTIILIFFRKKRSMCIALLMACLGVSIALVNVKRTTHIQTELSVEKFATHQKIILEGEIVSEPDKRPMQTKYTIEVDKLITQSGETIYGLNGKVLASDNSGYPDYFFGDEIKILGLLEKPDMIENFDYAAYLSKEEIYSVIYRADIEKIKDGKPSFQRLLFAIKNRFENQINKLYAEPHASFMAGLLTGSRKGIPDHLMDNFNKTGLTHIIAISGYNITIVITIIGSLLFWIPLKLRFFPEILSIIAFTLFVGASAAVVRAAIMGILGLLALQTGRQSDARLTVLWTISIMLVWNPKMLWYDAGFQLSFLAVLGLVELGPKIEKWFVKIPDFFGIREAVQMTIAAQISAVPIIVLLFGRLSLIAPIANLLVAPFIPIAMLCGFAGTFISFFWFFGGQAVAYIGWGVLQWIILVASCLSKIPLASVEIAHISPLIIGLYYLLMMLWIIRRAPMIHS